MFKEGMAPIVLMVDDGRMDIGVVISIIKVEEEVVGIYVISHLKQ